MPASRVVPEECQALTAGHQERMAASEALCAPIAEAAAEQARRLDQVLLPCPLAPAPPFCIKHKKRGCNKKKLLTDFAPTQLGAEAAAVRRHLGDLNVDISITLAQLAFLDSPQVGVRACVPRRMWPRSVSARKVERLAAPRAADAAARARTPQDYARLEAAKRKAEARLEPLLAYEPPRMKKLDFGPLCGLLASNVGAADAVEPLPGQLSQAGEAAAQLAELPSTEMQAPAALAELPDTEMQAPAVLGELPDTEVQASGAAVPCSVGSLLPPVSLANLTMQGMDA